MQLPVYGISGALRRALLRPLPATRTATTTFFCTKPGARDRSEMSQEQEQEQPPSKAAGNVMSHSFGEGYSTRADEEGFGGVYSENQTLSKQASQEVHENHPEYDKSQGSEVAEKEKGRNQPIAH